MVSTLTYLQACCFFSVRSVTPARVNAKSRSLKYRRSSRGCLGSNLGAERSPLLGIGIGFAIVTIATGAGGGTGAEIVEGPGDGVTAGGILSVGGGDGDNELGVDTDGDKFNGVNGM